MAWVSTVKTTVRQRRRVRWLSIVMLATWLAPPSWAAGVLHPMGLSDAASRHDLAFMPDSHPALSQPIRSLANAVDIGAVIDHPDLDGDGRRDLLTLQAGSGRVQAWSSDSGEMIWQAALPAVGRAIALGGAGDIDLDGRADVLVGVPDAPGGGLVQLLSGVDGQLLRTFQPPADATTFGSAVAGADDIDGDGMRELLVGDPGGVGRVWLISGADGHVLRSHDGNQASGLGSAVARLPDLDGDAVADYVIAAPGDDGGRAFVHSGARGDVLFLVQADPSSGAFGAPFLSSAGDLDADGIADLYAGAPDEDDGNGAAYVFSGRDGSLLFRRSGGLGEGLGPGAGAGDVDGDGHADLILGSPGFSGSGVTRGGRVSVLSGADGRVLMQRDGTDAQAESGRHVAAMGDLDRDGRLDLAVNGAAGGIELVDSGVDRAVLPANAQTNHSTIYWNPQEPGWGFNVLEQGDLAFGTWYTYADDGRPMFLTVQATRESGARFTGPVYRVRGTPFGHIDGAQAFTGVEEVGNATMAFSDSGALTLSYRVFGVEQTRSMEPMRFLSDAPICFGSSQPRDRLENYSDLWWNDREPGWGLTLAHQGDSIFALWYTYGQGGRDQWIAASNMSRQSDGSFSGALQRPEQGTPLAQITGPATTFPVPGIGSARLHFSDGENAVFEYSLEGVRQRKPIKRFLMLAGNHPRPHCVDPPEPQVHTEFITTQLVEQGAPVDLEMVVYTPTGPGPYPTVMFNHGSTGFGNDPSLFTLTWVHDEAAHWFSQRGWMVVFPQRRGRGRSDGVYAEGLAADGSGYTCNAEVSLAGMERALTDLDEVVLHLRHRPDVDANRMLIAGQSRGGILSIVYAGTRPGVFAGAVNFVGGWMGQGCANVAAINTASFVRGAPSPGPSVWLYGQNDPFYSISHSFGNFQAFRDAGGRGVFRSLRLGAGISGHNVINFPELWGPAVEDLFEELDSAR